MKKLIFLLCAMFFFAAPYAFSEEVQSECSSCHISAGDGIGVDEINAVEGSDTQSIESIMNSTLMDRPFISLKKYSTILKPYQKGKDRQLRRTPFVHSAYSHLDSRHLTGFSLKIINKQRSAAGVLKFYKYFKPAHDLRHLNRIYLKTT